MLGLKKDLSYFHSVKWGAAAFSTSFLRQLLLVPVFITAVGEKQYGVWLLLFSLVSFINAFSAGFLHYSCNLINISYHSERGISDIIYNVFYALIWVVLIQLFLGGCFSFLPVLSFFLNVNEEYLKECDASLVFLFMLGSRLFYQYNTAFVLRMFEPLGRIRDTLKFQFFVDFADVIFTVLLIFFFRSLLYACVGLFVLNTTLFVVSLLYVNREIPFFSYSGYYSKSSVVLRKSFGLNAGFFLGKIYDSWLNILVSHFFGSAFVPLFNVSQKLVNIFYRISYMIVQPLFPEIQKFFLLKDYTLLARIIKKHWFISTTLLIFSLTATIAVVPVFYKYWVVNTVKFDFALLSYLFMAISLQNFIFVIGEFVKKTNFSKQFLIYSVLRVVITLLFMWIFAFYKYIPGIGAAIAIAELVSVLYLLRFFLKNVIFLPQYLWYFSNVLIYCAAIFLYIAFHNYLLLLFPAALQLFIMLFFKNNVLKE